MWVRLKLSFLLLFYFHQTVSAVKIVALPINGYSHYKKVSMLGRELTSRGHQFTMLQFNSTTQWKGIEVHTLKTSLHKGYLNTMKIQLGDSNPIEEFRKLRQIMQTFFQVAEQLTYDIFADDTSMKILKNCDLIIGEIGGLYGNVFSKFFSKPYLLLNGATVNILRHSLRLPASLSYVPEMLSFSTDRMSVVEKIAGYVKGIFGSIVLEWNVQSTLGRISARLNVTDVPLDRHAPLVITQYDPVLDYPHPLHSNIVATGVWIAGHTQPLANKYTAFIQRHNNGVVLVSFGTVFTLDTDAASLEMKFIKALAKNKHLGFIVSSKSHLEALPSNVLVDAFLPQNDLLADARIKLFVSHAGFGSTVEACYHGVPVLALPRALDQSDNAFRIQHRIRMGTTYRFAEKNFDEISDAIPKLIGDRAIRDNAHHCSHVLKSRPIGEAQAEAANHIEWYISWDYNATHLRPRVLDMPWYEYHLLDVCALAVFMLSIPYLLYRICKIH